MKQPKKLTRDQKKALVRDGKDPKEWMLLIDAPHSWSFVKKDRSETFVLEKE